MISFYIVLQAVVIEMIILREPNTYLTLITHKIGKSTFFLITEKSEDKTYKLRVLICIFQKYIVKK